MNDKELISEIRDLHARQDRREGEPPMCLACSPVDWPCDAVRAADALEARQPSENDREALARVMDTLAYYHCRSVNPKADHPRMGYHAMTEDQREHLREKQREAAEEIMRMIPSLTRAAVPDAALDAVARVRALHYEEDHECAECSFEPMLDAGFRGVSVPWPCRTLAALDGAPEPKWEYGCRSSAHHEPVVLVLGLDVDEPEDHGFDCPSPAIFRRRMAGPWEPVGGETDGE